MEDIFSSAIVRELIVEKHGEKRRRGFKFKRGDDDRTLRCVSRGMREVALLHRRAFA